MQSMSVLSLPPLLLPLPHRQEYSFVAVANTIMRRTRNTSKCILRGLASGGINPREESYTSIMFRAEDWVEESKGERGLLGVEE